MISHLAEILAPEEGVEVEQVLLSPTSLPSLLSYDHLVFCGYDHTTLAHLFLALETSRPSQRITLYDSAGSSPERELNNLIFSAVDLGRMPASSTTRLLYSWGYRDILAIARQDAKSGQRIAEATEGGGGAKPPSRPGSRANRARQVENEGDPQA